jgi:arylsulfatase A-like enzyme
VTRKRLVLLAVGILVLSTHCTKAHQPNVLVITIDTLRADHLGCYGYARPTSPRIDAFAAGGVLFEKVFCQSPETLPSHTSIFTGLHPRTHKAISHESRVDKKVTTLAELLAGRGYTTGAIVSSHVLDAKYGLDQGFASYTAIHYAVPERKREEMYRREQDPTTDEALRWLADNAKNKFFLWVHWFHPHRAYNPPPRYREMFAAGYTGPAAEDQNDWAMKVWKERLALPEADLAYMRGLYDGEIAFTDAQVGRVIDALDSLGLAGNTIVVITSDHGEILYEHEYYFGHDIALYDECTMVPLVVKIPALGDVRHRVTGLVQSVDILPTVLEAVGLECPSEVEGKSLVSLMRSGGADRAASGSGGAGGSSSTTEYAFSETFPFPEKCPPRHAVRTETAKLIWREEPSGEMVREYYDLAADPGEKRNLWPGATSAPTGTPISPPPDLAARLDGILSGWIKPGGLHPAPIPTATDSGRLRILKSLGYVD